MADQGRDNVAIQIETMLNNALPLPTNECCIYKVSHRLRELNPDAYTPKVVSIGPYHHGNEKLLNMEGHKQMYCQKFTTARSEVSLDDLVRLVRELEPRVRRCYSENIIGLGKEEFIKVILVDCCFTLELLLRDLHSIQDDISIKPWLMTDLLWDLLLIENQLPFFVFKEIYNLAFASSLRSGEQQPFLFLPIFWFLRLQHYQVPSELAPIDDLSHFTDLYRHFRLQPLNNLPERGNESLDHLYSVTELKEAGVKFGVNKVSKRFLDLKFSGCYLRIPQFKVADHTEMILRNMVAFEQYHYPEEPYFTDYILFLDCLINTEKDVDILVSNKIIVNWLGDSKAVAKMFNGLGKNVLLGSSNTNYLSICNELDAYCNHFWHRGMTTLRRDYCNTPWKTVASIAAIALLILTIIQTVFSILQVVL